MGRIAPLLLLAIALFATACAGGSDEEQSAPAEPTVSTEPATPFPGLEPADATPVATEEPSEPATDAEAATAVPVGTDLARLLTVKIIETLPHDPAAFTQGLLVDDGLLIESTGLRFESDLRRVNPDTGEVVQIVQAPGDVFAEGLTKVGDELIQLTWKDEKALYWDAESFELKREVSYPGEGWGLCYDGDRLVMSDGSPTLVFRQPDTFDEIDRIKVTLDGSDLHNLNELECVDGKVWANVWRTDLIVRIDPTTGFVEAVVDASSLEQPRTDAIDVLNGIAYDEATDSFFITGKLWPTMYRVQFVTPGSGTG